MKPLEGESMSNSMTKTKMRSSPHSIKQWQLESIGVQPGVTEMALNEAFSGNQANITMDTRFSTWTPITNKSSNHQLFQERMILICHWFDLWTDRQRKQFLHNVLMRCSRSQLKFTRDWFTEVIPITKLDFTTVLPRFISLYIFSFLNPKELCIAAQVSWHWKFLAEQDCLWIPKCVKLGWFVPYTPADNEYGAWKRHYLACAADLDYLTPREAAEVYGTLNEPKGITEEMEERQTERAIRMRIRERVAEHKKALLKSRPAWLSNSWNPGTLKTRLQTNKPQASLGQPGLTAALLLIRENTLSHSTLSKHLAEENKPCSSYDPVLEKKLMITSLKSLPKRKNACCGSSYPVLPHRQRSRVQRVYSNPSTQSAPHLILVSSRVPSYEMLLDSLKVGVVPVVYDYTGITLESLLFCTEQALQGEKAQSIGIFTEGHPGEISLSKDCRVNTKSVLSPEIREFWEKLAGCVVSHSEGGCLDIFIPLAASEAGMEVLSKISALTGLDVSTPTGIATGSYQHICSEWLGKAEAKFPCVKYFIESKLLSWCRLADVLEEALKTVRKHMKPYLQELQEEVCGRIIGQFMFDSMGLAEVQTNQDTAQALIAGLVALTRERYGSSLEFLSNFLMGRCKSIDGNNSDEAFLTECEPAVTLSGYMKDDELLRTDGKKIQNEELAHLNLKLQRDSADKRTMFAREVLQSENNYVQLLEIIRDIYVTPLKAALSSNRGIVSAANVLIIFSDVLDILELNRQFLEELKERLQEWGPSQCLGDVFIKFSTRLNTYTNFFNNYSVILKTIDKCRETIPAFRAFLKRHDRTVVTKMMCLQELLLFPSKRFEEYVTLLYGLRLHTPPEHTDRANLTTAVEKMKHYRDFIRQLKQNMNCDPKMLEAQRSIQGCPNLMEANRYLIQVQDVAQLSCPGVEINASLRIYDHVCDLTLFLFNDAVVITSRSVSHVPFEHTCKTTHRFLASVALHRLFIEDIPDTKYIKNAFVLQGPKRQWICVTEREDHKCIFLSVLQSAINAAIGVK
ncbi:epithelial cell-transforming sequence 2 oncogene-like isoform X1 [Huso huso]|uniref:Epithelial cell-transforming sequence 2 oncogene-like isoform X1 n=1 Tax=Huso huso TaxID=61971 RepID=A0ABR0ZXA8_HUSHU